MIEGWRVVKGRLLCLGLALVMPWSGVFADLSDPTRPPLELMRESAPQQAPSGEEEPVQEGRWRLSMVLITSSRAKAVINDQAVHVGEQVDGLLVESILPSVVQGRDGENPVTLYLPGRSLLTPSP
ncbi:MAG: hypothetical protein G8345_14165 [Magnetococcales bacterium]|nr:hypothetical protein [Magnetococcales bacterium]NGZ28022.1 hypothetical protein [Magnetococcales bacterium]